MMDNNRNSWQYWEALGSYLTDTGGDHSVPNFDWQLPVDPDASRLHTDLEDHHCDAFSSEPFESTENAIPSTNWEFSSPFPEVDLNGNSYASPESRKNSPGPENLGMCSRASHGPLPQTTAAITGRNKVDGVKNSIDGVKNSKTGRRHRGPNWTIQENRSFLHYMEVQKGKSPWKAISDSLKAMGFDREKKACEDHWGVLLADLKKFQKHFGSDNIRDVHIWSSVGTMSREHRSQNGLPLVFEVEWLEKIARIDKERSSKHRKKHSKGRIHDVAGTPSSSSCRQQPRVSAATPSSEIFDNFVGDGAGIDQLVNLLGSADRNVTVDQTIELMRIRLEADKINLRKQEIELEKDRMNMYRSRPKKWTSTEVPTSSDCQRNQWN